MTEWSHIIAAGVGPIIVISACGLLCLALYNRLTAVVTRLRSFQRERLHEQESLARLRGEAASGGPAQASITRHEATCSGSAKPIISSKPRSSRRVPSAARRRRRTSSR